MLNFPAIMQGIRIENLDIIYQNNIYAIRNLNLEISKGVFFTVLGPSGAGKSSILFALAGLLEPPEVLVKGKIMMDGNNLLEVPASKRNIPLVFQNYALFPHLNVFENIAFPLRIRKVNKDELKKRVYEILNLVKLNGYEKRKPAQLSGGQKQRVALGRALIIEPEYLLLDEPLGALDKKLRDQMQVEIKNLQKQLGVTIIYVTHDQTEALSLSDRIAVIENGNLLQVGSPKEVYENPLNSQVADFIGESNLSEGIINEIQNDRVLCTTKSGIKILGVSPTKLAKESSIRILIRPENISILNSFENNFDNIVEGRVRQIFYLGDRIKFQIDTINKEIFTVVISEFRNREICAKGDIVKIGWSKSDTKILENI